MGLGISRKRGETIELANGEIVITIVSIRPDKVRLRTSNARARYLGFWRGELADMIRRKNRPQRTRRNKLENRMEATRADFSVLSYGIIVGFAAGFVVCAYLSRETWNKMSEHTPVTVASRRNEGSWHLWDLD